MMRLWYFVLISHLLCACSSTRERLPSPSIPLVVTPDESFRKTAPVAEQIQALVLPALLREQLDNGLSVLLLQRPGAPLAAVRYVTRRGGEDIPRDLAGRAWMVSRLIQIGAAEDGDEQHSSLATEGIESSVSLGFDSASVSLHLTKERLPHALELLAKALRNPSFSDQRVEQARNDALRRINAIRGSPDRRAYYWALGMLYGLDHRAAVPLFGRAEELHTISGVELQAFHHISWGPRDSALIVVGDIEMDFLMAIVDGAYGGWSTESPSRPDTTPWVALDSPLTARGLGLESWIKRNLVMVVEQAPSRGSDDSLPFEMLAATLGSLRSARINQKLRGEPGASLVDTSYDARLTGGELVMMATASRRGLSLVLQAMVDELERMVEEGPDEEELTAARAVIRERYRATLERTDTAAEFLAELFVLGRDLSEISRIEGELEDMTVDRVRETARRWLRPDRAPVVVTGDLDAIGTAFMRASISPAALRRRP